MISQLRKHAQSYLLTGVNLGNRMEYPGFQKGSSKIVPNSESQKIGIC